MPLKPKVGSFETLDGHDLTKGSYMICIEIFLNGKKICLAGVDSGVLATHLTVSQRWIEEDSTTKRTSSTHFFTSASSNQQRLDWPDGSINSLVVGDEVTLKIVESDTPDEPVLNDRERKKT